MRRIVFKFILFGALLAALLTAFFALSMHEPWRTVIACATGTQDYLATDENDIVKVVEQLQTEDAYTKLILGDSVCYQLFNPLQDKNSDYRLCGTNRAVTIAGQYLLAREFLEHHPNATDVYLYLTPDSLAATYDTESGYVYAAAPFALTGLVQNLQPQTQAQLRETYTAPACTRAGARIINRAAILRKVYLNAINEYCHVEPQDNVLTEDTGIYLRLLDEMCKERGAAFHLIAGPVSDNWHNRDNWEQLNEQWQQQGLDALFPEYFSSVHFYDRELFADGVHFADGEAMLPEILQRIGEDYGLLGDLIS